MAILGKYNAALQRQEELKKLAQAQAQTQAKKTTNTPGPQQYNNYYQRQAEQQKQLEEHNARAQAQTQAQPVAPSIGGAGTGGGANNIASVPSAPYSASGFPTWNYQQSQAVTDAYNNMMNHNANRVADWTGGQYGQALKQAMDKILNREKFSYDLNGDALYQQYKDQYMNQGRLAMQDAIGQASAMTGGYGNSYASTVGNQAYQGYLQQLNNVVPELYRLAYDKYNREGDDLYNQYGLVNDAYNTEYGQYRDKVSDWYNEANRLSNAYNTAYNIDYGQYSDRFNNEINAYKDQVANNQYAQEMALKQAQLAENIRSNKASEQLAVAKAQQSGVGGTNASSTGAGLSPEMEKASNSSAVKLFNSSVMTPSELAKRGNTASINGKSTRFDDYSQYIDAVMEKWYKDGKFTANEVAYLKGQYNL